MNLEFLEAEPSDHAIPPKHEENWETYAMHFIAHDKDQLVTWVLIAGAAYYLYGVSIVSDHFYDCLFRCIDALYDDIEHPYKDLITQEDVDTGSLFTLLEEDYPPEIKLLARVMYKALVGPKSKGVYEHKHYELEDLL